jgi:predicted molibdopterin-dependent oxidoreductase YjgC
LVLRYSKGSENAVANGILNLLVQAGKAQVPGPTADAIRAFTPEHVESVSGVPAAKLREAAEIAAGSAIVTSRSLYNAADGTDAGESLAGVAMTTGGTFNCYGLRSNDEGAAILFHGGGKNTHEILEAAANGEIKSLWLLGVDPFNEYPDRDLVQRALETAEFVAYQGIAESEAFHYASVVLPMTAPAEQDGTYTNCERRVQRMSQILATKGDAKAAWRIFSEIFVRLRPSTPKFNPGEVMDDIAAAHPEFDGARYSSLPTEGHLLS